MLYSSKAYQNKLHKPSVQFPGSERDSCVACCSAFNGRKTSASAGLGHAFLAESSAHRLLLRSALSDAPETVEVARVHACLPTKQRCNFFCSAVPGGLCDGEPVCVDPAVQM